MIKLRVQGTPEEVGGFADALDQTGAVLERSRPYANRGESRYVRVYMDVEVPTLRPGQPRNVRAGAAIEPRPDGNPYAAGGWGDE